MRDERPRACQRVPGPEALVADGDVLLAANARGSLASLECRKRGEGTGFVKCSGGGSDRAGSGGSGYRFHSGAQRRRNPTPAR